jgi:SWIM zinc finger
MGLEGVEDEDEYAESLQCLKNWLGSFTNQASYLQDNAKVLLEFLVNRIIPFKARWFFPGRKGLLTLNHKTTSPLESINMTLKCNSGLHVRPNMSLFESFRTQEQQVNTRMNEKGIKASEMDRSLCLFSRAPTASYVSTLCETNLIRQRQQSAFYACIVDGECRVKVKRLPGTLNYCRACEKLGAHCAIHCSISPIPTFSRTRILDFIEQEDGNFEMRCSCPYYATYGLPCRHQICVLQSILPSHVIARHHNKFSAHYKKPNKERITAEFDKMKHDYRLIITQDEYECCMVNAELIFENQVAILPNGFWQQFGPSRCCENGVIRETAPSKDGSVAETFLGGAFSQDISLSQSEPVSLTSAQQLASMQMVHQNSNLYHSSVSKIKGVVNSVQMCNKPEVESFFTTGLDALIRQVNELVIETSGFDSNQTGEYVSSSVPLDRRQKHKRIKSKSEPSRKTKQLYKGERTKVLIKDSSLITTGTKER